MQGNNSGRKILPLTWIWNVSSTYLGCRYSSSPLAARTVVTKSTWVLFHPELSPCTDKSGQNFWDCVEVELCTTSPPNRCVSGCGKLTGGWTSSHWCAGNEFQFSWNLSSETTVWSDHHLTLSQGGRWHKNEVYLSPLHDEASGGLRGRRRGHLGPIWGCGCKFVDNLKLVWRTLSTQAAWQAERQLMRAITYTWVFTELHI